MNNNNLYESRSKCRILAIAARNTEVELEVLSLQKCSQSLKTEHIEEVIQKYKPSNQIIEILCDLLKVKILDKDMDKFDKELNIKIEFIKAVVTQEVIASIKNIGINDNIVYKTKHEAVKRIMTEIIEIQKICPEATRYADIDIIMDIRLNGDK